VSVVPAVDLADHDRPVDGGNLHVAGLRTPFADGQFDQLVNLGRDGLYRPQHPGGDHAARAVR
jgi:hypothetical protein